jgi:hypothetical protein
MDAKDLGSRIDLLEDTFRTFAEAGLFSNDSSEFPVRPVRRPPPPPSFLALLVLTIEQVWQKRIGILGSSNIGLATSSAPLLTVPEKIAQSIRKARELVDQKSLARAAEELVRGELIFQSEICRRSRSWRLIRVHQAPIFVFYLIFLSILAVLALSPARQFFSSLWGVPAPVLALGMLGAILRGLYWLQYQVSRRIFRAPFVMAHFAAPWIGLLLAVAAYLLTKSGLFVLQSSSASNDLIIRAVAFFAGFNWTWFLTRLSRAFEGKESQSK